MCRILHPHAIKYYFLIMLRKLHYKPGTNLVYLNMGIFFRTDRMTISLRTRLLEGLKTGMFVNKNL